MAKANNRVVTINWQVLGQFIVNLLKFVKWPITLLAITYICVTVPDYGNNFQPNYELILRYIDVIIWPLVTIGAIWFVKPNLPDLIGRLEELNLLGNNAKFSKNQFQDNKATELTELDANAAKPATKVNADYQVADDETHTLLSSYEAAAAFAQLYVDIFGTQIDALRRLVDYTAGLKAVEFSDILERHKRLSGGKGYSDVIPFMEFLLQNTLVLYDQKSEAYKLTNAGYYFLVFLHKAELLNRPKNL